MLAQVAAVPYRLANLAGLVLGQRVQPSFGPYHRLSMDPDRKYHPVAGDYHPSPGVYTVRELVSGSLPLLESVVVSLGSDRPGEPSARKALVDGLAASLSTSGRESTFPLTYRESDSSRRELAWQAERIGKSIVRFIRETVKTDDADPDLQLYSQCEGHLWTSASAALLLGPRSSSRNMQIYNEWLHRMILLRDSLLPFENFEEVPLVIQPSNKRGLREFEQHRKVFLLECLTGGVSNSAIVDASKVFTTGSTTLPKGGYGMQYSQGLILPAFLSGSASIHLLRYHGARLDDSQENLLFDYEHPVYFRAPRHELIEPKAQVPSGVWPPPSLMTLNPRVQKSSIGVNVGSAINRRVLQLQLEIDTGISVSVDIGQISRGYRYAYRAAKERKTKSSSQESESQSFGKHAPSTPPRTPDSERDASPSLPTPPLDACPNPSTRGFASSAILHASAHALAQNGLVTASKKHSGQSDQKGQVHVFPAKDPLIGLALLGKLYPENVILLDEDDDPEHAEKVGKGFGARFVVLQAGRSSKVERRAEQAL